jgi:hypothetical protein
MDKPSSGPPAARRFTLPLSPEDHALLEQRAAEEGMPKTTHVRRLIRADAAAHQAAAATPAAA